MDTKKITTNVSGNDAKREDDGFAFRNGQDDACPYLIPRDGDKDVTFDHYENTGDMSISCKKQNIRYDVILVQCDEGEVLEDMQLVSRYKVNGKRVETPVTLISEPPTYISELQLAKLIVSIAKKLNK